MKNFSSFEKLVGITIKNYQLIQFVEQNAFGATFLARHSGTQQMYQLRLLDGSESLLPEERLVYLGQFQQEASKIASLQHPAIHPLVDYGNYEGTPYLISSYIPTHHSLANHLKNSGSLDMKRAGYCLNQIVSSLEYAHLHTILHGNLAPQVIFLVPSSSAQAPSIVMADFGLVGLQRLIKQDGQQLPHPDWAVWAPEQLSDESIGPASDVYALGALLYQMLTGHSIFEGNHDSNQMRQAPVPSLTKWSSHLPQQLDNIIQTAMAKQPEKRYQRALDLANAYHQIIAPEDVDGQSLASSVPVSVQSESDQHRRSNKAASSARQTAQRSPSVSRRQALFVITGVGTAAVVAGIAWASSRLRSYTSSSIPAVETPLSQASSTRSHTGTVIAHAADVPINHAVTFQMAGKGDPAVLIHLPNNNFVAFDSVCTHASCTVAYNSDTKLLECPCHGAKFDPANNAAVKEGPAPTPLSAVKISVNADGTITTE